MPITPTLPTPRLPDLSPASAADAGTRPGAGAAAAPPAPTVSALPNPSLRLDAALGLVVLEFRDADGTARTIPNERELEAYRSAARVVRPGDAAAHPAASGDDPQASPVPDPKAAPDP